MQNFDDDDDTHFCNKCHTTINGLSNYVRHRQEALCRSRTENKPPDYSCEPTTPSVSYPEILNADAFFNSLELQSSAKQSAPRSDGPRRSSRHRKRKTSSSEDKDYNKVKIHNLLPVDSELEDLGLPSLVGFSDIVPSPSTASNKVRIITTSDSSINKENNALKIDKNVKAREDEPQEREAMWPNRDTTLTELADKGYPHHNEWTEYNYQQDLESEDDSLIDELVDDESDSDSDDSSTYPPRGFTGGKWKPELVTQVEEPMQYDEIESEDIDSDSRHPPSNYTGGKWKPLETSVHTGGKWKPSETSLQSAVKWKPSETPAQSGGKWKPSETPAQSGGKWKPSETPVQSGGKWKLPDLGDKWKPSESSISLQKNAEQDLKDHEGKQTKQLANDTYDKLDLESKADDQDRGIGFWCHPCGRKLASQLLFERHLASDLHARRTNQGIDEVFPSISNPIKDRPQKLTTRQKSLTAIKISEETEKDKCLDIKKQQNEYLATKNDVQKSQREREKKVIICEVCKKRVLRIQIGKHLVSHYHCRVAAGLARTKENEDSAVTIKNHHRIVLENMRSIVHQCPFQCAPCRFYCNSEATFLRHWQSKEHKDIISKIEGNFSCSQCCFICDNNEAMELHLNEQSHRDVVSMINGSVPIVIHCLQALKCRTCSYRCRYNIEMREHAERASHEGSLSSMDEYQNRLICRICQFVGHSRIALQRHQLFNHKSDVLKSDDKGTDSIQAGPYFCSFCWMSFDSREAGIVHRRTISHKETVKKAKAVDPASQVSRKCRFCNQVQSDLLEHKRHILQEHRQDCPRCAKCGQIFALSQELARHTRDAKCSSDKLAEVVDRTTDDATKTRAGKFWNCDKCPFTSESKVDRLYHKALHEGFVEQESSSDRKCLKKLKCPVCDGTFAKISLKDHIRAYHTQERPFTCPKCSGKFPRRSALTNHEKTCGVDKVAATLVRQRERKYDCKVCGSSFFTGHALRQHMMRHDGKNFKCDMPGCLTELRTKNELRRHKEIVHDVKGQKYYCNDCSYVSKSKQYLITHWKNQHGPDAKEKEARFTCNEPGCNFRTPLKTRLTRHARVHTGERPYKCPHCDFSCNNLENLRKHVVSNKHPGKSLFSCRLCQAENAFETNLTKELKAHLVIVHPETYPTALLAQQYINSLYEF
ncbi:zinc finger protein 99-like [Trichogramma pretiosum]|uniref:zinc finger protein 99-like n=1 Tax=Trichogramma pretiosum TaxID=7493 RepID=UPI000C71A27B|nr:zinc finger protein 99-like [Trichogramma pretiosum]